MSLAPGTPFGPYRILALIGAGGMGEVYRARDPKLGREVAIKVLPERFAEDPERLRRFEREARALATLAHPNILDIHDFGSQDGVPYLVMELLEGQTLRRLMDQGPMTAERVAELAEQVARGLAAAHERGIVHRDLKPENLFVTTDRVVKILDFGLAKGPDARTVSETGSGTIVGTVSYLSPEQASGAEVDFRSDQFTLAVVMWELLTGRRPFQGGSVPETLAAIARARPPSLMALGLAPPAALQRVMMRCLARDPSSRYPSTRDLARDLGDCRSAGSKPGWWRGWRSGWRGGVALAGILVFLAIVGHVLRGRIGAGSMRPAPSLQLVALPARVLGSQESAFLSEVVPDTLSTLLAGRKGLEVKSPPSPQQVAEVRGDLARISRAYEVDRLVLSTVTSQGDGLFLNLQLVEAATQRVVWAGQFQGTREDYRVMLGRAAEALAGDLHAEGAPAPPDPIPSEVALALGEGRYFLHLYQREDRLEHFARGSSAYQHALDLDQRNTAAMSGLADLWRIRFVHTRERAAIHTAEDWARRALRLDPGCAGAWYELAWTSADQHLLEQAIEFSLKAVHFSPGTAQFHFGLGNTVTDPGSCRLYLDIMREATRLDPLNTSTTVFLVDGLIRARRPQEALQTADRALAIRTNAPWLHLVRARALVELGRTDEAERVLSQWRGQVARSLPWIREYWEQVHVLCRMEQLPRAQAVAQARILVNRYLTSSPDQYSLVFALEILAPRLVRLGLQKEAMDLMEKKTEIGGPPNLDWLCEDPDLQLLRGDPRFTRILSQAREADRVVLRCFDRAAAAGERPAYLVPAVEALRTLVAQPLPGGA